MKALAAAAPGATLQWDVMLHGQVRFGYVTVGVAAEPTRRGETCLQFLRPFVSFQPLRLRPCPGFSEQRGECGQQQDNWRHEQDEER